MYMYTVTTTAYTKTSTSTVNEIVYAVFSKLPNDNN